MTDPLAVHRWEMWLGVVGLVTFGALLGFMAGGAAALNRERWRIFAAAGGRHIADFIEADLATLADYVIQLQRKDGSE